MKHCIIGAGFSGLPIAKKLIDLGEEVDVLDKNSGIGGLWHTGVYKDAHIISSKFTTEFPEFPMPDDYPDFPSKDQMQNYFDLFADHFKLRDHIQLNTLVTRVKPARSYSKDRAWEVTLGNGEKKIYKTVTIANGHNWHPNKVSYPGHFSGEMLQSNEFYDRSVLKDKRVLVVGHGNTGCDLAVYGAQEGKECDISMRSGNYFFPKMFMGIPLADILYKFPLSFDWLDRFCAKMIVKVTVGDLGKYGIQPPNHKILDKHPIVNTDLIQFIRHGRIKVQRDIAKLEGKKVHFVDGISKEYDLIVFCTGYKCHFPMLDPKDEIIDFKNSVPVLFMNGISPKYRGLFLPGLGQARTGGGPIYERGGHLYARMISYEGKSPVGIKNAIEGLPMISFMAKSFIPKNLRLKLVYPASFKSRGIGEIRRKFKRLEKILEKVESTLH